MTAPASRIAALATRKTRSNVSERCNAQVRGVIDAAATPKRGSAATRAFFTWGVARTSDRAVCSLPAMSARDALRQAGLYGRTVARVAQRGFREPGGDPELATEWIVFVVGSPLFGTTLLTGALGSQPRFVDLREGPPVKSCIKRSAT